MSRMLFVDWDDCLTDFLDTSKISSRSNNESSCRGISHSVRWSSTSKSWKYSSHLRLSRHHYDWFYFIFLLLLCVNNSLTYSHYFLSISRKCRCSTIEKERMKERKNNTPCWIIFACLSGCCLWKECNWKNKKNKIDIEYLSLLLDDRSYIIYKQNADFTFCKYCRKRS